MPQPEQDFSQNREQELILASVRDHPSREHIRRR